MMCYLGQASSAHHVSYVPLAPAAKHAATCVASPHCPLHPKLCTGKHDHDWAPETEVSDRIYLQSQKHNISALSPSRVPQAEVRLRTPKTDPQEELEASLQHPQCR